MKLIALIVCAGAITAPVLADTVDVRFLGMQSGFLGKAELDGTPIEVFLGQFSHEFANGTGAAAQYNGIHMTFCTDLSQMITDNFATYDFLPAPQLPVSVGEPVMGAVKAQALYDIFAVHGAAALAPGADANFAASFQAAVWEIVYDFDAGSGVTSLDVNTGRVKLTNMDGSLLTPAVVTGFNNIVGSIGGGGAPVLGVGHNTWQDQLFVPAPGSLALVGLGAFINRRRRAR